MLCRWSKRCVRDERPSPPTHGELRLSASGTLATGGGVDPLAAIAFIGIALRLNPVITAIGESVVGMFVLSQVLGPIGEVLDADSMPEPARSTAFQTGPSVELDRVTFGYQQGQPVLQDVSFTVPPQTMTAIVGHSGSGKTTVARLVSRFYDPWEGNVRIGGQSTGDLTLADLMSQMSLVFQGVYLFDETLLANIKVGNPSANDEATSALDAENEDHLTRAFENLRSESTVLVIAHKLSTIENADQIVVLDQNGTVAQRGTHAALRGTPGIYQDFCARREQAQGWQLVETK